MKYNKSNKKVVPRTTKIKRAIEAGRVNDILQGILDRADARVQSILDEVLMINAGMEGQTL